MPRTKHIGAVWLRCGDLRLSDNRALHAAATKCDEVLVCFCWCPREEGRGGGPGAERLKRDWSLEGTALQAFIAEALKHLDTQLRLKYSNRLVVLGTEQDSTGAKELLTEVLQARKSALSSSGHDVKCSIFWNRRAEPWERQREAGVQVAARGSGFAAHESSSFLFKEPEDCPIFEAVGRGMHIFKAFWDGWHKGGAIRSPLAAPVSCAGPPESWLRGLSAAMPAGHLALLPADSMDAWPFPGERPWSRRSPGKRMTAEEVAAVTAPWAPLSEDGAWERLERFLDAGLRKYHGSITRDAGPQKKESRLSPYYRLGLLSMVEVYHYVDRRIPEVQKWLRRSAWRDYAYWMMRYWEELPERPMRLAYLGLPWSKDEDALSAWKQGKTGFPLIDAAMRELLTTGYLQQNMRHTVGQFLVEVLGHSWVEGELWFHETLADCDAAINAMMWQHQGLTGVSQWLTGIDCHPVRHAKKADPDGAYVQRFCPELARLPKQYLHSPWLAPPAALKKAGVVLGQTYPERVVQDPDARKREFMVRFQHCRSQHPDLKCSGDADSIEVPRGASGRLPSHMSRIYSLTERAVKAGRFEVSASDARGGEEEECAEEECEDEERQHATNGPHGSAKGRQRPKGGKGLGKGGKSRWQAGGQIAIHSSMQTDSDSRNRSAANANPEENVPAAADRGQRPGRWRKAPSSVGSHYPEEVRGA
mmetsp:Transcript_18009/g.42084  ORF Transcript_18009/g.42084 Transcript_18009/m.42084 type:complete len:703 (-) Transcript_18009:305-2413(-)